MDKFNSVKPIGMPQGTANIIKPAKVSSVDFEEIPIVAVKVKNLAKFSTPGDMESGIFGNQVLVNSDPSRCPINCLDFCH